MAQPSPGVLVRCSCRDSQHRDRAVGIVVLVPGFKLPASRGCRNTSGFCPCSRAESAAFTLAAGLILTVMVLPIITAISREVIKVVPVSNARRCWRLGADTLGSSSATRSYRLAVPASWVVPYWVWDVALGETDRRHPGYWDRGLTNRIAPFLLPGYTLSSVIVNQFGKRVLASFLGGFGDRLSPSDHHARGQRARTSHDYRLVQECVGGLTVLPPLPFALYHAGDAFGADRSPLMLRRQIANVALSR